MGIQGGYKPSGVRVFVNLVIFFAVFMAMFEALFQLCHWLHP